MVKKIISSCLGLFVLVSIAYLAVDQGEENSHSGVDEKVISGKKVVEAYYFHTAVRCHTCNLMERYIRETVYQHFASKIESGDLKFRSINVDNATNTHFINTYHLYTKTLIISLRKDGKEIDWINCDKIWKYAGNEKRFKKYVKSELTKLLES